MANNLKQTFDLLYQLYHGWSLGFLCVSWFLSIARRRRSRRRFELVCEGDAESCSDSTHPTATNFCQRNLVSLGIKWHLTLNNLACLQTFFKETKFDIRPGAKVRRKKIHPRQMLEKSEVAKCYVFRASGESKSRLVKAAGAESCMWSEEKSKLHAAVASSAFSGEHVQNTSASDHFLKFRCRKITRHCGEKNMSASDHFLKFRCRKIARGCGEKHISKCFGAIFEVQMSKI